MFEKEAEEYAIDNYETCLYDDFPYVNDSRAREQSFKDGANFGYNKANEWYFVKDKLPPSGETVLLYFGTDIMGKAVICTGSVDCKGNWYKNVDKEPIKWQEIVLPKETNYV